MTVPLYVPFFVLAAWCWLLSPPAWVRRVNWLKVSAWAWTVSFWTVVGLWAGGVL